MFVKSCRNSTKSLFVLFGATARVGELLSFLEKSRKTFLQFDSQKKIVVKLIENLPQQLSEKLIGDNLSIIGISLGFFEIIDYRHRFSTERFIVPITGCRNHHKNLAYFSHLAPLATGCCFFIKRLVSKGGRA